MFKPSGRRGRRVGVASALVLVAAGAAWSGGSPLAAGAAEPVPECFGQPATIIGTPGDDTLTGTPGNDVIVGLEGTDVINTDTGGTDRVCAGPNALSVNANGVPRYEEITFGSGLVDGGPGLDRIAMSVGGDGQILGGSNPTVVDKQGRRWPERILVDNTNGVEIFSGDGPDRVDVGLSAETGTAKVDAGAGHDVVYCFGDDIGTECELYGGSGTGNDRLRGAGAFTVKLDGGSGNDVLSAVDFDVELDGGPGNDAMYSRGDTNTLRGGPGNDRLTTYSQFHRGPGPHILQGGSGDDYLVGHDYSERFGGGSGSDTVRAGGGADTAWGSTGPDVLGGASGRDSLYGGAGRDANYGGSGSDLCRSPQSGPRAHSCQR